MNQKRKKNGRGVLSMFLVFAMVCSLLAGSVFAAYARETAATVESETEISNETDYSSDDAISAAKETYGQEDNDNFWYVGSESSGDAVYAYLTLNEDERTYTLTIVGSGAMMDDPGKSVWASGAETNYAPSITEIRVGEGVTNLGRNLIRDTTGATVYIPASVTTVFAGDGSAFANGADVAIVLADGNTSFTMVDGVLFTADLKTLVKYTSAAAPDYTIPDGTEVIGTRGFSQMTNLETVTIADTVKTMESYALQATTALTELDIPDSVTELGADIILDSYVESVTMGTGMESVPDCTFYRATKLSTVYIGENVTSIGYRAFYQCTNLTTVVFAGKLESIGDSAFCQCESLKNIEIPSGVTEIGQSAFINCTALSSVTIPETVETIGNYAFKYCSNLLEITIPSGVTSMGSQLKGFYKATVSTVDRLNVATTWQGVLPYGLQDYEDIDGYTVLGWYGADGTGYFYFYTEKNTKHPNTISEATTVYAVYSATVTADGNNADNEDTVEDAEVTVYVAPGLDDGQTIESIASDTYITSQAPSNPEYTRDGYTFIGWNTEADGSGTNYAENASLPVTKEGITLYAEWVADIGDSGYTVNAIPDQIYTGAEINPTVVVKDSDRAIVTDEDEDCTISVEYSDNINVGTATAEVSVTVNDDTYTVSIPFNIVQATPTMSYTEDELMIHGPETGDTVDNALSYNGDGEVSYESSNTEVAAVSTDGTVTLAGAAGETTITATAAEGSNYTAGRASYTLTVTAHEYDEGEVTAPTCTAQGYTTYTCTVCGDSYAADYTDPAGHTKGEGVVTKAATCTEAGEMTYTCTVCGELLDTETIAATGHDYDAVVTAPTCTAQGYTTYTCTVCGDSYAADYTDPAGHTKGEGVVTKAATCTEAGEMTYTCTVCGELLDTETIAATGHDYDAVVTAPTCTAQGYTTYTCSVCGDSHVSGYTDATGHSYDADMIVWTWATDYSSATATLTCGVCGERTTATATVTSSTADGTTIYTATVTVGGVTYTATKTTTGGQARIEPGAVIPDAPDDSDTPNNSKPDMPQDKAPQTGDNSHLSLWLALMPLSLLGLAGTIAVGRKTRYCGAHEAKNGKSRRTW